tara:strand:+ start:1458 stop:5795 length:4338 start_codon:yes stop_codon:yes gene_type:complete
MVKKKEGFYLFGTERGTQGPEFNVFKKVGLGAASGLLKIPESIAELGAAFSDYAFDTELVTALEKNFPKINVTDGVGKFVEIALQYGVPYGAALKIGGKMGQLKRMKELGESSKKGASKIAGKMGYYGLPAVGTDFIVGTARDSTLGETFGLYKSYDEAKKGKTGQRLAEEVLKQRGLLALEGGALAGLITTALPPALSVTASGVAKGAGYVSKVGEPIINPVTQLIGNSAVGKGARKTLEAIKFAKEKIDPLSLKQLNVADNDQLRFLQRLKLKLGHLLTPEGAFGSRETFEKFQFGPNTVKSIGQSLQTFLPRAYEELSDAMKILQSKIGEKTLTRQDSILRDIGLALDVNPKTGLSLNDLRKRLMKNFENDKESVDKIMGSMKNIKTFAKDLDESTREAFRLLVKPRGKPQELDDIGVEIKGLLDRQVGTVYRAFDKTSKFKFEGKEFLDNKKAAINDAFDVLKRQSPRTKDSILKDRAKRQINSLINQAKKNRTEGSFFREIRRQKGLLEKERGKGKGIRKDKYFTSIQKEMLERRDFVPKKIKGKPELTAARVKYGLSLRNLLGGDVNPLRAFEDKYFAIATQLGQRRFVNELLALNNQLGAAVAGRAEKTIFTPTKTKRQLLKEGVEEVDADELIKEDIKRQIAKEYGIPEELAAPSRLDPSKFIKKGEDDPFGIYDAINPKLSSAASVGGYFTSPGMAQSMAGVQNYTDVLLNIPLYKSFLMGKAGTQIGKTILSPVTQIRNFTSAAFFALHNGHIGNPFGLRKGNHSVADVLNTHLKELFPKGRVDADGLAKVAAEAARKNELGVTSGSIVQREIDDLLIDIAKEGSSYKTTSELFDKIFQSKTFREEIADSSKKLFNKAQQFYTKGDDFWKDYGFRFTYSQLNKIIPEVGTKYKTDAEVAKFIENAYFQVFKRRPTINNVDGKLKSRKELLEEFSAEYIKNTYPNYQYVPNIVKEMRRLPLGNFISFPAEILRTSTNLLKVTSRELAIRTGDDAVDAYFRQMGSRRLIGQMAGYTTGPILAAYSLKALGISDEQYDALRESQVADWNKFSDLIIIGKERTKDGNVKYRYLNFAYQNPYDYIRAPFYTAIGRMSAGEKMGEDFDDRFIAGAAEGVSALVSPFLDEAILSERLLDWKRGSTRTGKRIWEPTDPIGDKVASGFAHVIKGVSPGVMTQISNVSSAIAEEQTRYGKQYKLDDELLALLSGVRVYEADIKNNLNYSVNDYLRRTRVNKARAGQLIFAANVTPNTITSAYETYVEESYKAYNTARKVLDDAETLGLEEREIQKLLKQRKVAKDIRRTLRRRKFVAPKWRTFYNDQRFKNIARERGIPRVRLFPMRETEAIRRRYNNFDLFKSISEVRNTIRQRRERATELAAEQTTGVQGTGLTAQGQPLVTPGSQPPIGQVVGTEEPATLNAIETALLTPSEQAIRLRTKTA